MDFVTTHSVAFHVSYDPDRCSYDIQNQLKNIFNHAVTEDATYSICYRVDDRLTRTTLMCKPKIKTALLMICLNAMTKYRNKQLWHFINNDLEYLIRDKILTTLDICCSYTSENVILEGIGRVAAHVPLPENQSDNQLVDESKLVDNAHQNNKVISFSEAKCVICLDKEPTHVFVPCGHWVCCSTCVTTVSAVSSADYIGTSLCPICQQSITQSVHVFYP